MYLGSNVVVLVVAAVTNDDLFLSVKCTTKSTDGNGEVQDNVSILIYRSIYRHRTGEDRTGDDRKGEDKTGDDRSGLDRTGEDKTGDDRRGEDGTGQERDRTGDDRRGEDRTGDNRTGTRWY